MINIKPILNFLVVILLIHWLEFWGTMRQSTRWKEWAEKKLQQKEAETKKTIQKQTEQHKEQIQELKVEPTQTKTELLLTQNKLRESKEK